jgi:hypothetical protein
LKQYLSIIKIISTGHRLAPQYAEEENKLTIYFQEYFFPLPFTTFALIFRLDLFLSESSPLLRKSCILSVLVLLLSSSARCEEDMLSYPKIHKIHMLKYLPNIPLLLKFIQN